MGIPPLVKTRGILPENFMKLNNKLMDSVITDIAGEEVLCLIKILKNKKNISEFKLAEQLDCEVNAVRNMLYRLYNNNLVSFTRRKDKQKGWYIYYWTFKPNHIKFLAETLRKKRLGKLKERLAREIEGYFYICPNNCIRLDLDQATDFEFRCPECGAIMADEDNRKKIADIEKEIKELEKELKSKK